MSDTLRPEPRRPSTLLMLGLLVAPLLFSWFLLRRGYSSRLRFAAFTWMAACTALGLSRYFAP